MKSEKCPHCGNVVEGHKKKTYASKVGRQGVKSTVHGLTSVGGVSTGAAFGSIFGPIGTVVGGAAGWVGSAMFNQAVNSNIDKAVDFAENSLTNVTYEFHCPKCGHSWEATSDDLDSIATLGEYDSGHDRVVTSSPLYDDVDDYEDDDYEKKEMAEFRKCWREFFDKLLESGSVSKDQIDSLYNRCSKKIKEINHDVIASEYYYLISLGCYFFIKYHEDDSPEYIDAYKTGYQCIIEALDLLTDDAEYKVLNLIYDIMAVDPNDDDAYETLSELESEKPDFDDAEDFLFKKEYLEGEILNHFEEKYHEASCYYLEQKDYQRFKDCLLKIVPSSSWYGILAYYNLSHYFDSIGDYESVKNYAKRGVDIIGEDPDYSKMDKDVQDIWVMLFNGYGCACEKVNQDYDEAFRVFSKLHKVGYPYGALNLAEYFELGHGTAIDIQKAISIYKDAIMFSQGDDHFGDVVKKATVKIEELSSESKSPLSETKNTNSAEQEYIDMLNDCIVDGAISEKERRGLERLRKALGITEYRAKELEDSLSILLLTKDEQEYKDTILEYYEEDGEITSKARKMLDKLRVAYNISEQRAKEIESSCGK